MENKEIKIDVSHEEKGDDVCFSITGATINFNNMFDQSTLMFFLPKDKADELGFKTGSTIQDMERANAEKTLP